MPTTNAGDDDVATYGVYGTPTHHAFYAALNALEGGYRSWALPSGLAACTMALSRTSCGAPAKMTRPKSIT